MEVAREIRVAVPPSTVWEAWTTRADGWFPDRVEGETAAGGTIHWLFDGFGMALVQQVDVVEPERRLVLSAETRGLPKRVIDVSLAADGDGTRVSLVQSGLGEGDVAGCDRGWAFGLAILRLYCERHFGRPRHSAMVMRPVDRTDDALFATPEGLARWFTTSGGLDEGLVLRDGQTMSAKVIERMLPEILVTWDEIEGVFAFKAFETGPSRQMIGLYATGWAMAAARVRAGLDQAADRLAALLNG